MKKIKLIVAITAGLLIVLATILSALAEALFNKGGWIAEAEEASQAVATSPYPPIVALMGIGVLIWCGYELYKRYKK